MQIERLDGVPPHDAAPGNVWWHATVYEPRQGEGGEWLAPCGFVFEAPPEAPEAELRRAAEAKWQAARAKR